ncbi:class I SAM-dependent methyltransferase [Halorhodospira halochloris]|uniref:class I SAM-dependent methyltransferase n=1 Tax=Halorhodospira halochloris TaxID=1052 RepID=UPI001EE942A9|nr:methyltransferase domain-containing protein [Halorhodospira halochloris]MCG5531510.1 class I SAM-dependent methyltransferase [Halorhodospira halochloris]
MPKKSSQAKDTAWAALRTVGLRKSIPSSQFWSKLHKKYPDYAARFWAVVQARGEGLPEDPFTAKNADVEFSYQVTSQYDSDRLYVFLDRFRGLFPSLEGGKVLDIGCDNGALTLAMALLYPNANFHGVDSNSSAIAVCIQKARELGVNNIGFTCSTVETSCDILGREQYDVVLTNNVMHVLWAGNSPTLDNFSLGSVAEHAFSYIETWQNSSLDPSSLSALASIRGLLSEGGVYVSLDRWPDFGKFSVWVQALEQSDFQLDVSNSNVLVFEGSDKEQERMPLTIARVPLRAPLTADEAFSVFTRDHFFREKAYLTFENPDSAETVFSGLNRHALLELNFVYKDGSGNMIVSLGTAGALSYLYATTSRGYRRLSLAPLSYIKDLYAEMTSSTVIPNPSVASCSARLEKEQMANYELDVRYLNEIGILEHDNPNKASTPVPALK